MNSLKKSILNENLRNPEWLDDVIDNLEEKYNFKLSIARRNMHNGIIKAIELTNHDVHIRIYSREYYNTLIKDGIKYINEAIIKVANLYPELAYYIEAVYGYMITDITEQLILKYAQYSIKLEGKVNTRLLHNMIWVYTLQNMVVKLPNNYIVDAREIDEKVKDFYADIKLKISIID